MLFRRLTVPVPIYPQSHRARGHTVLRPRRLLPTPGSGEEAGVAGTAGVDGPGLAALTLSARAREALGLSTTFTVVFYGSAIFCRKTAQLSETLRESAYLASSSENKLRNIMKTSAKTLS